MKDTLIEKDADDIEEVKSFLLELGFDCVSYPSAQNLIYKKNGETVLIKNNGHKKIK
jgi:hypothetical protein